MVNGFRVCLFIRQPLKNESCKLSPLPFPFLRRPNPMFPGRVDLSRPASWDMHPRISKSKAAIHFANHSASILALVGS
jgi:hypothetical protein